MRSYPGMTDKRPPQRRKVPGPDWVWAVLAALVMVASYVITALALGLDMLDFENREKVLPIDTGFWAAIMTSVIFGLSIFFSTFAPRLDMRALKRLPLETGTLDGLGAELKAAENAPRARRRIRFMMIGALVTGLVFGGPGIALTIPVDEWGMRIKIALWFTAVLPLVFAYFTRSALLSFYHDATMFAWLRQRVRVDLLDPDPLKPFAAMALNRALRWSLILTALALILLGSGVSPILMVPLILAWLFVAVQAFLRPMRGIHARLVEEKRSTLKRLNSEIEAARVAMEAGDAAEATRIQGLISYRGLIEAAKEWPYDMGTLARLLLYLAIPVGGWIGGALVEQIIEAVL